MSKHKPHGNFYSNWNYDLKYKLNSTYSAKIVVNNNNDSSLNLAFLWIKVGWIRSNNDCGIILPFSRIFNSTNLAFSRVRSLLSPEEKL